VAGIGGEVASKRRHPALFHREPAAAVWCISTARRIIVKSVAGLDELRAGEANVQYHLVVRAMLRLIAAARLRAARMCALCSSACNAHSSSLLNACRAHCRQLATPAIRRAAKWLFCARFLAAKATAPRCALLPPRT